MTHTKPYLLFDLGGVLVELAGGSLFLQYMNHPVSQAEFNHLWLHSQAVRLYETGKLNSAEFAARIIPEFGFKMDSDVFLECLSRFIKGPYNGVLEMLEVLKKNYSIGLLSNTNAAHWEFVCREFGFDQLIPTSFLSYRTGLMKPDLDAFLHAAESLGLKPDDIIYFDDNAVNVKAAQTVGFHAYCVTGDQLRTKLTELGLYASDAIMT